MEILLAIAILTLLVAAVSLAYSRGWIPPKYVVASIHPSEDPLLFKIFGQPPYSRKVRFVIRYMIPQYKRDGYKVVKIAFGREFPFGKECIYTGKVSDTSIQETVLMALPKDSKKGEV